MVLYTTYPICSRDNLVVKSLQHLTSHNGVIELHKTVASCHPITIEINEFELNLLLHTHSLLNASNIVAMLTKCSSQKSLIHKWFQLYVLNHNFIRIQQRAYDHMVSLYLHLPSKACWGPAGLHQAQRMP